jgi:glycosyltransferase involved in cell wall biosynthesis
MNVAIIPAFNPDIKLIELVKEMRKSGINNIIVVNDGSDKQTNKIFWQLDDFATVLIHEVNKGKGAAIKTALKYLFDNGVADIKGIVTLDADGQHRPEDAINLLNHIKEGYKGMILGVRSFKEKIPIRSQVGNTITKYVFRLCSGTWVSDTQTGLRAFSADMMSELLNVSGDRYEYEMNVLLTFAKNKTLIKEVPIATIYHDNTNSCSHFRAIRDSLRIYGNLLAFTGASFVSFLLDYILFFVLAWVLQFSFSENLAIIISNIAARSISAAFNYYLNSTFIFRSKDNRLKSGFSYALLACLILFLNTIILYILHDYFGLSKAFAKLLTELTLFVISFMVQKFVIFSHTNKSLVTKGI